MYNETAGKWQFWITFVGVNVLFFPQHFLGMAGMPRRIPDYALQFADFNLIASIGGFVFGFSQLLFVYALLQGFWKKREANARVWDGARGLEWTVDSPAPQHTFGRPPHVTDQIYQY